MHLDGHHRTLRGVGGSGQFLRPTGEVGGRGPDGGLSVAIRFGLEAEAPAAGPLIDERCVIADPDSRSGKDPAVVGAARPRAVLVDRAPVVDQHRAMPPLVVAEQDMSGRLPGCRKQQLSRDVGEDVGLIGSDVDEL